MPVIINISTWIKRIIMLLYIISPVNTDENTIRICFEKRKSDIFSNIPGRNIEGTKYPEIYEDIIIMEKYDIMLKCSLLKSPPRKWEKAAENKRFNWELIGMAAGVVVAVLGIGASILGGNAGTKS